jgi:predicted HAD superfamily phosphohydrolase YqeG
VIVISGLPILPIPKCVEVTKEFISIDGRLFPHPYVTRSLLVWLQQTLIRWSKEDDSEKNKEWINGLVKAFEDGVAGKL